MLDESFLDAPDALARADVRGLLRGAAESGARVRTAARHAAEAGITALAPDGRPRAVLVAGPGPAASCAADLLAALSDGSCLVQLVRPTGVAPEAGALRWTLPGWTGPLDLLLLVSADGSEPGLAVLVEQAYRRGCSVVCVAPTRSPLTGAVGQARGLAVPLADTIAAAFPSGPAQPSDPLNPSAPLAGADDPSAAPAPEPPGMSTPFGPVPLPPSPAAPGTLWALLTPLLSLADRIGLLDAPPAALEALAERLDKVAERCGPAIATYNNPAKTLATELADALPLLWTEGTVAGAAGRHFATVLTTLAGRPALAAELPEALTTHGMLLAGAFAAGTDPDDFFRDRVEDTQGMHARIVLLRGQPLNATSPTPTARELALRRDTPVSELQPAEGSLLETAAELLAITDFAAVYLSLASSERS
ncbi:SIS domain-containing protein [Streptomyces sp. H27-D2]|uniref:SIS domain-containing protein n=1 Tax=Streptomyces sp. H27-D2 TaxID=3046304 RepID=UPI002DBC661B|nr:SIS domain-containing protein [Streptomyces sp. H27-D2]MEC4020921.1 SIS domain-containing protein [Streptomyces sp. H27-D2]